MNQVEQIIEEKHQNDKNDFFEWKPMGLSIFPDSNEAPLKDPKKEKLVS